MPAFVPAESSSTLDVAAMQRLKVDVHHRLLETLNLTEARQMPVDQLHREVSRRIDYLLGSQKVPLAGPEKQRLLREVLDEIFGLGPIEELMADPTVSDVLANGPHKIYIERHGRLEPTNVRF